MEKRLWKSLPSKCFGVTTTRSLVPVFLCPALLAFRHPSAVGKQQTRRTSSKVSSPIQLHAELDQQARTNHLVGSYTQKQNLKTLPIYCPGCGALTQTTEPSEAGYYTTTRRSLRHSLKQKKTRSAGSREADDEVYKNALACASEPVLEQLGLSTESTEESVDDGNGPPLLCDRCHNLIHHQSGVPINHPSVQSIRDTIEESPHMHNHVYHILDAADFPLSLIRNLDTRLTLSPLRSKNRRSRSERYIKGRKADISFVITRSDLLAPTKQKVDSLMPYLIQVLRDALGSRGEDVRLGNVRCVSAHRGWWTRELKEEIWRRGGGNWMVGKVNVGKSRLFTEVFPKGRNGQVNIDRERTLTGRGQQEFTGRTDELTERLTESTSGTHDEYPLQLADEESLLPPPQAETAYPIMPTISSLPGTTASPIRVPYGNGKGELVDLPGIDRGCLSSYVMEDWQNQLLMRSLAKPEQMVIKPGQSLLLGGLIRITPTNPDIVIMAYAFLPLKAHVTSTEKAIGVQLQTRDSGIQSIALPDTKKSIGSAGVFPLKWDVTRHRSGPLTSRSAVGRKPEDLPFKVLSTDILIEGCGWVELVAQVRRKGPHSTSSSAQPIQNLNELKMERDVEQVFPCVEVFSPEGKFLGARRPLNAWIRNAAKDPPKKAQAPRPIGRHI